MPFDVVNDVMANIWYDLHAQSATDAVWWNDGEITRMANAHLRHLSQNVAVDVRRDISQIVLRTSIPVYAPPLDHLSTISIAYNGQPLRPSSTFELERRDATFQFTHSTANTPITWWYSDKQGATLAGGVPAIFIGFYPIPSSSDNGQNIEVIYHHLICDIDEGHTITTVNLPKVFGDWLELVVDGEAFQNESDGRCLDIAGAAMGLGQLYMQAFESYYGKPQ